MKRVVFSSILLIITASGYGQPAYPSKEPARKDYLQKSKKQKSIAWILSAGGLMATGGGLLIAYAKNVGFDEVASGIALAEVGVLSVIGSIPLFIASGKNKKRGMALSAFIKMENAVGYGQVRTLCPSLSINVIF